MKKLRIMLSVFALMVAASAAVASTWSEEYFTTIWRKENNNPTAQCQSTNCVVDASLPCGDVGFSYYLNAACNGSTVTPKRN